MYIGNKLINYKKLRDEYNFIKIYQFLNYNLITCVERYVEIDFSITC